MFWGGTAGDGAGVEGDEAGGNVGGGNLGKEAVNDADELLAGDQAGKELNYCSEILIMMIVLFHTLRRTF